MSKDNLIASLNLTREQTLHFFELDEPMLQRTYGRDKWSIRQILHHLCDSEQIFMERLKRIIAEPKQVIWAYDQDKWNDAFDYQVSPLGDKKQLYNLCRLFNMELVDKFFDTHHDKPFIHSEAGLRKLGEEFERIAIHNNDHIKQIETALMTTPVLLVGSIKINIQ
ncbi:MAG TPA: DinB family protein [Cyclobacteriaceae bacterium]|nr:DinB family protein [Cyclobacteriaceae bacterium]